jgi:type II secretory pathway pseudopilin PulG
MSPHQDKYNSGRQSGFTLVEALVSLALLTTALVPTFILATDAVKMSLGIRNSLIAANLAQEGVEVVRAMRDANWFAGPPTLFSAGLLGCASGCRVQWNSTSPLPLGANPPLKLNATSGLYQYDSGADSLFTRVITVKLGTSADELVVSSVISWKDRSIAKTITVESHLFDWMK